MTKQRVRSVFFTLGIAALAAAAAAAQAAPPAPPWFDWSTVVNNNDLMPGAPGGRTFNSYNPPSVNVDGLVVIRARSRGGPPLGPATHGIYTRHMGIEGSPVVRILDRTTQVPEPNNLWTTFVETPSFPRIDMWSDTIATRGNHQPVWEYTVDGEHTRAGTTGIYTNPYGDLVTGAAKLGDVPDFWFWEVPGLPGTRFEVFPGAPSVSDGATLAFKGNFGVGGTGVYYRALENAPAAGESAVMLVADNRDTLIPGTGVTFGSLSPPTAVDGMAVFAGFDDERNPALGGIYLAPLEPEPTLTALVSIGERVPGGSVRDTFTALGEGIAFDGRYVAFWGAWGNQTRRVRLHCPEEGNKSRIAYCNQNLFCEDTGEWHGDSGSICDDTTDPKYGVSCYQEREVPVRQGFFVHDTVVGDTRAVATTVPRFHEFLFWNYSGRVPCMGGAHGDEGGEDDGEPARWRSAAFIGVSGLYTAFKARAGDIVGIYLARGPGQDVFAVVDNRTDGQDVDPEAPPGSRVTEVGVEREGVRGDWLVVSAKMGVEGGTEEEGMAGIYATHLPRP